jgi:hypothetical protein
MHIQGLSDIEILEKLGNSTVRWAGALQESTLDRKYARGVILAMPALRLQLREGAVLDAGHLFVKTRPDDAPSWRRRKLGQTVHFEGRLIVGNGPFPGVRLSANEADGLVLLMPGVVDGRVLNGYERRSGVR